MKRNAIYLAVAAAAVVMTGSAAFAGTTSQQPSQGVERSEPLHLARGGAGDHERDREHRPSSPEGTNKSAAGGEREMEREHEMDDDDEYGDRQREREEEREREEADEEE